MHTMITLEPIKFEVGVKYTLSYSSGFVCCAIADEYIKPEIGTYVHDVKTQWFRPSTTHTFEANGKYLYLSYPTNIAFIQLEKGEVATPYTEKAYELQPSLISASEFEAYMNDMYARQKFAYTRNGKVIANKVNDSMTAIYSGIDFGSTPRRLKVKYIMESLQKVENDSGTTQNVGVMALICNGNGLNCVNDITAKSLHLTITDEWVKLDLLGNELGECYYFNFFTWQLPTKIPMDGITEVEVTLEINSETQKPSVTVSFGGNTYTKSYHAYSESEHSTEDPYIEFIGRYCTFEHFCEGDRNERSLPMFTYFGVEGDDTTKYAWDYFEKEDGKLNVMPTGHVYHCISNAYKNVHS